MPDAQQPLGDAGALRACIQEAGTLASTAGAFVAVWEDGNLVYQEHAHLVCISSWTALATCRCILRGGLRRILVTPAGVVHAQLASPDSGKPTPRAAKGTAQLAFRYIRRPFAAVTFGDAWQRRRGVMLVAYADDAEPTKADLDALARIASHAHLPGSSAGEAASDDEGPDVASADATAAATAGFGEKAKPAAPPDVRQGSFARQLHDTLDNIPDALCLLDQQWRFTFLNQRCERMIGRTRMDLLGQVIWEAFPQLDRSALLAAHEDARLNQVSRTVEVHLAAIGADFEIRIHPGRHGIMLYFHDITERKRKEREVEHLAQHDTLTGLPNRFALEQVLEQQSRQPARWAGFYAVLFIDLDGFKDINDTCGHVEADGVLVEVGRRLQEAVRNQDTVARYGGDEFVVVLCGLSDDAAAATEETERVAHKLLDAVRAPILVGGRTRRIDASIGAAISPIGKGEAQCLLRQADTAMYRAKRSHTGQIGVFDGGRTDSVLAVETRDRSSAGY